MRSRLAIAVLLLTLALAACAHAPQRPAVARDAEARSRRVFVTGSRIPQRVDPATGRVPVPISPVQVVTRAQIVETGRQGDLAAALRTVEPAMTTGP